MVVGGIDLNQNPVDVVSIRAKMENMLIVNFEQFEEDVSLMFQNAQVTVMITPSFREQEFDQGNVMGSGVPMRRLWRNY